MTIDSGKIEKLAEVILQNKSIEEVNTQLAPDTDTPYKRFPNGRGCSAEQIQKRWDHIQEATGKDLSSAFFTGENLESYDSNIENCVGTITMPVGIAGPYIQGIATRGGRTP